MTDNDWVISNAMIYDPIIDIASDIGFTSFTANWIENYTATKYYLDVSTDTTFATFLPDYHGKEISDPAIISHTISDLTGHTKYYYRLQAYNWIIDD